MKFHRVLAEGCAVVLGAVLEEGMVLDRVLETTFGANSRWGKRDRAFVAETVFEVTRWRRALEFVADSGSTAALCAAQWRRMGVEVPEDWDHDGATVRDMEEREGELPSQPRAVRESIPDWLDQRGVEELGGRWDREITALNERAPVYLRVNSLAGDGDVSGWLAANGVSTEIVPGMPDALKVVAGRVGRNLLDTGRIEIQDIGSQRITPLLEVEPGMKMIDACAGAGGKTLHAAALMENRGEIIALDVSARKLHELARRAANAGVSIVRVQQWKDQTLRDLAGWADCVLIDAPCSGLGTLRRQPDLKWRLTEPGLEKIRRLQRRLLDHYTGLLRPGGRFVYATCSVLPSENEGQVSALFERDPRWRLEESMVASPADGASDGFYAARLRRIQRP